MNLLYVEQHHGSVNIRKYHMRSLRTLPVRDTYRPPPTKSETMFLIAQFCYYLFFICQRPILVRCVLVHLNPHNNLHVGDARLQWESARKWHLRGMWDKSDKSEYDVSCDERTAVYDCSRDRTI